MCKREMPGLITDESKWTVGGVTRGEKRLTKNGAVRCVMEESLDKNGKDWLLDIVEVEAELSKVKDGISYQIMVRGHSR